MKASDFDMYQCIGQGAYAKVMESKVIKEDSDMFGNLYAVKIMDKKEIMRYQKQRYVQIEKKVFLECGKHPNIVSLHFTFQDEYSLYFVMDLCSGTLFNLIDEHGTLSEDLTRHWLGELVLALEHMHSKNIVHRDIKPENVLIHADRHVRLTDFGTCRLLDQPDAQSPQSEDRPKAIERKKSFVGTADYVAPELLQNTVEAFQPLDWWAVGVMIYQCLTGKTPFRGGSEYLTFQAIIEGNLQLPESMSPEAKDICKKLLNVKWQDRLGTNGAQEVKDHPFFAKLDWDQLSKTDPPPEPEKVTVEGSVGSLDTQGVPNRGTPPSCWQRYCCCCCTNSSVYFPEANDQCSDFLLDNEAVVLESMVKIPGWCGKKERILVLTNQPRLFFIDWANQYVDIDIPWSGSIYVSVQSDDHFILHGGDTSVDCTLVKGTAGDWAAKINELHNKG